MVVKIVRGAVEAAPEMATRVKEDILTLQETRRAAKAEEGGRRGPRDRVSPAPNILAAREGRWGEMEQEWGIGR